jgi:hypothetical protein
MHRFSQLIGRARRGSTPRQPQRFRWLLALLLAAVFAPLNPLAPALPAQAQATAPQFLRDISELRGWIEDADTWTVGGGFLYWSRCTSGPRLAGGREASPAAAGDYLRRWPLRGGRVVTLASNNVCVHPSLAADDSGLYYYDMTARRIIKRSTSDPFTAQNVADTQPPNGAILLDRGDNYLNNYIYWLEGNAIRSADKLDFSPFNARPEPLGSGVSNLTINGLDLVYFADGYIYSLYKICLAFGGGGTCIKNPLVAAQGNYLNHATLTEEVFNTRISPFWVNGSEIQGYWCRPSCGATTAYTAPTVNGTPYKPGKLASDGQYLFWVENQCIPDGGPFGGCTLGQNGRLMKWNLQQTIFSNPFDLPQPIACRDCGASYSIAHTGEDIAVADGWVYFMTSSGLSRIRADAPPVAWDLAAGAMEVTQGVQGLNNDVPLVADKPTYVRLFGNKLSGPGVRGVDALLHGKTAGGAPLPGSPLRPVNGARDLIANNIPVNRGDPNASWIFQLPPEWARAGAIRLSSQIDPRGAWNDPNRANNSSPEASFSFIRKAPICVVFIPVRADPRVQMFTPSHWFAIEMIKRLLPTPDVWVFHQNEDVAEREARFGIPPWKYGPYEMDEGGSLGNGLLSDSNKVILSLWTRDQFSDDPDRCDDARARTHYAGVVHAGARGNNGTGSMIGDQLWFRLPPDDFSADWKTERAVTLAHELAHNYGRRHVDCPVGGPDDVGSFPYASCQIDFDDNPDRHFGFTYNSFRHAFDVISPTMTGDLMSYAHQLNPARDRWTSDFSWRGILNEIPNGAGLQAAPAAVAPAAAELAQASSLVLIAGAINTVAPANSALEHAWVLPSDTLSRRMLQKWQRTAAERVSTSEAGALQQGSYHLRLRDASGTLLDDRVVTLESHPDDEDSTLTFQLSFPAPAGQVARIELLDGETLLASLSPGTSPPSVEVISPAGGETFDNQMTLAWRASDPDSADALLYTVQYSPDSGQTWRALLTGFPNLGSTDTVSVPLASLSGIPASTSGGLIRVLASDGYNTAIAVSQPFSLPDRGPQPTITSPWPGQSVPAGQTIILQGAAIDAEDGSLSGDALRWAVDGTEVGTGQERAVAGLAPGQHSIALTARDAGGLEQTVTKTLTVEALRVPLGDAPTLDGECADDAYAGAAAIPLAPYADGSGATVRLLRSNSHLWACFTNLARASASALDSLAVLRVDADYGRDAIPQPGDYVFALGEDGVPETYNGNNSASSYVTPGPGGLDGRVSANGTSWQAELRIDAGVLGGWNRVVGLDAEHVSYETGVYYWPRAALWHSPSSWAATALGELPQIVELAPASATAGAGGLTLTVNGTGFLSDTVVRWGGEVRPTTVISPTQLQATIGAADLAAGNTVAVSVGAAAPGAPLSNALPFFISPAPLRAPDTRDRTLWLPLVQR